MVGRASELAQLRQLLDSGERLVTIHGPAGIGKTRLAVELVADLSRKDALQSGVVYFVGLEAERDVDGLGRAIAGAMGLVADESAAGAVGRHLASSSAAVLVLDNLEQLLPDAAGVIEGWLQESDAVLVVTSRHVVGLPCEHSIELAPLAEAPAVELFIDCVRAFKPSYTPGADELGQVELLVAQLEGIPLAIELAAARMRLLSPAELVQRVAGGMDMLSVGTRRRRQTLDSSPTLRSAIASSWDLLDEVERSALMQCSVFRGSFSTSAAEAVLSVGGELPVIDLLQSLREKSLLRRTEAGLALFESVRRFAAAQLEIVGGAQELWLRHARHVVGRLGRPTEAGGFTLPPPAPVRPAAPQGREELRAVLENLMGLPVLDAERLTLALRAVVALDSEPFGERLTADELILAERALSAARETPDVEPLLLARASYARGRTQRRLGYAAAAERTLTGVLEDAEALGAGALSARTRAALGEVAFDRFRMTDARHQLELSMKLFSELGDVRSEARAGARMGVVLGACGALAEAQEVLQLAAEQAGHQGDPITLAWCLSGLGRLALEQGNVGVGRAHLQRAIALAKEEGVLRAVALFTFYLGLSCFASEDDPRAQEHLNAALTQARQLGESHVVSASAAVLAASLARSDRIVEAMRMAAVALATVGAEEVRRALVEVYVAHVDVAEGRRAAECGDISGIAARLRAAQRVAGRVSTLTLADAGRQRLADVSADARVALQLLQRALDSSGLSLEAENPGGESLPTLEVAQGARWFKLDDGEAVSLAQRAVLRRVLWAICQRQMQAPGQAVPTAEVVAAAWPGERMAPRVGASRLYVAVGELRKVGLREALHNVTGGYYLRATLARAGAVALSRTATKNTTNSAIARIGPTIQPIDGPPTAGQRSARRGGRRPGRWPTPWRPPR